MSFIVCVFAFQACVVGTEVAQRLSVIQILILNISIQTIFSWSYFDESVAKSNLTLSVLGNNKSCPHPLYTCKTDPEHITDPFLQDIVKRPKTKTCNIQTFKFKDKWIVKVVKHMRLMNFDVDVVHCAAKRKWNLLCPDYTGDYKRAVN